MKAFMFTSSPPRRNVVASFFVFAFFLTAAHAGPMVNAGFETGVLTGWTVPAGTAEVVTHHVGNSITYLPQQGSYFVRFSQQPGAGQQFPPAPNTWAGLNQTFFLKAGDTVEGWAAFDWRDGSPRNSDAAQVVILRGSGFPPVFVANPYLEDGVGQPDFADLPWTHWSWTAANAGTYTLQLLTKDADGAAPFSYGLFDAWVTTPAPEPATLALLALGLAGVGYSRRKRT